MKKILYKYMGKSCTLILLVFISSLGFSQETFLSIENIAGNGTSTFTEGPALESGFNSPGGVVEDSEGNLFFTVTDFSITGYGAILRIDGVTGEISE